MAGWHHRLNGRESEWTPGVGDGQGGLACCNSWGCKESDTTEWLNWTELKGNERLHQIVSIFNKNSNSTVLVTLPHLARTNKMTVIDIRWFIFILGLLTHVTFYELLLQYNVCNFYHLAVPLENCKQTK